MRSDIIENKEAMNARTKSNAKASREAKRSERHERRRAESGGRRRHEARGEKRDPPDGNTNKVAERAINMPCPSNSPPPYHTSPNFTYLSPLTPLLSTSSPSSNHLSPPLSPFIFLALLSNPSPLSLLPPSTLCYPSLLLFPFPPPTPLPSGQGE